MASAAGVRPDKADDAGIYSQSTLKSLLVLDPDSVLALMDSAELLRPMPLPQFRIDIIRGLAYNEKNFNKLYGLTPAQYRKQLNGI